MYMYMYSDYSMSVDPAQRNINILCTLFCINYDTHNCMLCKIPEHRYAIIESNGGYTTDCDENMYSRSLKEKNL